MKAELYKVDETIIEVKPKNGTDFSLKELQLFVGGSIDIVYLSNDKIMVVHSGGKLLSFAKNENATRVWKKEFPIADYPYNNNQLIVGDIVICDSEMVK